MISVNKENKKNVYMIFFSLCQDKMVSVAWADSPQEAAIEIIKEAFDECSFDYPISTRVIVLDVFRLKGESGKNWFSYETASLAQDAGLYKEAKRIKEIYDGEESGDDDEEE